MLATGGSDFAGGAAEHAIKQTKADLIVVGSHGVRGTEGLSMSLAATAQLLWSMVRLAQRENWERARLEAFQAKTLGQLRSFVYANSPFYRKLHAGMEEAPLSDLPIVTKRQLMDSYDDVLTDQSINQEAIHNFIEMGFKDQLFDNRYVVCATSGTSGTPGLFLYSEAEWAWILASFARASRLAGAHVRLFDPMRLAIVGSDKPSHQSNVIADSFDSPWVPTLRLAATDPLGQITSRLNDWNPEMLVAYSALASTLADQQLQGQLDISPRIVMCVAESLKPPARKMINTAWGVEAFENYAATETGVVAAECSLHQGLHLFEDLVIVEVVDERGREVAPDAMGARALITSLFARTFPLIRYELDDSVSYAIGDCSCGLPFRRLSQIGGRVAETLRIARSDGTIAVLHPIDIDAVFATSDIRAWQIICHKTTLEILLLSPVPAALAADVERKMSSLLASKGLSGFGLTVNIVDEIPRLPSGKMVIVRDAR